MQYITLTPETIATEHICCAFSDKKSRAGYQAKKDWLSQEFELGYRMRRLDERAKVFIEYGPVENAWAPVIAQQQWLLGCFWVSGKYKGQGHGKHLLHSVIGEAQQANLKGLLAIAGKKKIPFCSDAKWLKGQGFQVVDETPTGFQLLQLTFTDAPPAKFAETTQQPIANSDLVVYYSNRCPFTDYYVNQMLVETAKKRGIALHVEHIKQVEQAQACPSPATIFSVFHQGKFVTTDISICLDSKFDKFVQG